MSSLLELRENLRNFYSRNEVYLLPLLKFLLALGTLMVLNLNLGYMTKINSPVIVLVVALMCSFLPMNLLVVIAALFVILHSYAISMECAIVAGGIFLLMFLLYYRFSPKDTLIVLLLPICFGMKIPYVVPVAVGLLCGPASVVSVTCGVVAYYVIRYIKVNAAMIMALDADSTISKFRYVLDGIIKDKAMMVVIISFCVTTIIVYIIRRLSVDHAWTIAMFTGAIANVVILLVGNLMYETNISVLSLVLGTIVALAVAKIVEFFAFNVDYTRTEYVQFEDDEYYYYVKAIPKNTVAKSQHTVKKITSVL
ncbi:MAG: hypothetical protein E7289_02115 [Lachnospiraceae bacterium]|nr:hypothetical protein [Lachnospiraceae bacterium]